MVSIQRVVLDVLKPHDPSVLEFARAVANECPNCRIVVTVAEMDEKTETIEMVIEGPSIDVDAVGVAITAMGASLHSIDEVEVFGGEPNAAGD